ncbi:MAG: AI-2E family transporter [Cyclobacteriaceae bacterium]|nr:AI-2E family transporter [Cyclobacteriaceae bacterium]
MQTTTETPFYLKLSLILISLFLIILGFIYGKDIILPILFSILLANILLPITNFLSRKKLYKPITIFIPVLLSIVACAGIVYFLSAQIVNFMDDVPALRERINEVSHSLQVWFRKTTNITIGKQNQYIAETVKDFKENASGLMGSTVVSLTGILAYAVLIPIYTFLILYYRSNIKSFLIGVFNRGSEQDVREVLTESTTVAQQYLTGLFIETTLVFLLNMTGFLILGIKYAVFLALFAALMNLIPYVGILVANVLCMLVTLVSSTEISTVVWVGVILAVVQFLDNNFGMPLIVGNKVRINALVTIIGVLVGGALCGIPGMFLAIPGLAVLKVIFDKVPDLQPWGALLGDETEKTIK